MSSRLMRLTQIGYALGLSLILCLLLLPSAVQAQKGFGTSTGYRATPGLPTIAIALPNISGTGAGGGVGGGATGFGGGVGGASASFSFNPQPLIIPINLGQFFPNNGQIIGLPGPTMMPPLNNFAFGLFFSDSSAFGFLTALGGGAGGGIGGAGGAGGAGGFGGVGGGGIGGGGIAGGGMGGFAGKGMGGFNGKKPL
jgi:hypothetical protein